MTALPVTDLRPGQSNSDAQRRHAGADTSTKLSTIIRERLALSDEADPHVIAAAIADDLPADQLRDVVREGLVCIVRAAIRTDRNRSGAVTGATRSAKWEGVAKAVAGNPDIFQRRYKTADGWKFLGDFTKSDAEWNQAEHEKLADACSTRARQFSALASRLKGRVTVRDSLKPEDVQGIFDA